MRKAPVANKGAKREAAAAPARKTPKTNPADDLDPKAIAAVLKSKKDALKASVADLSPIDRALKKIDTSNRDGKLEFAQAKQLFEAHVVPVLTSSLHRPLRQPVSATVSPVGSVSSAVIELREALAEGMADVWVLMFNSIVKLLDQFSSVRAHHRHTKMQDDSDVDDTKDANMAFLTNVYVLLAGTKAPFFAGALTDKAGAMVETTSRKRPTPGSTIAKTRWHSLTSEKKRVHESEVYLTSNAAERKKMVSGSVLSVFSEREQRSLFSRCWTAFLAATNDLLSARQLSLLSVHILVTLTEDNVIAHLTNPLLLADYFVHRFRAGGLVSVLSLKAIFVLMIDHGLEQPDYYEKLYSLITPEAFASRHRADLLKLLDLSLKSSMLSTYVIAAVIKRVARVSLLAPGPSLYFTLPFLRQLLQRHPNCLALIHRTSKEAVIKGSAEEEEEEASEVSLARKETGLRYVAKLFMGEDPYNYEEPSIERCNAIHSTLWELSALERHYLPACAPMVAAFQSSAEDTTPLSFNKTYARLFTAELTKDLGPDGVFGGPRAGAPRVPVAYTKPRFAMLDEMHPSIRL